MPWGCNQFGVLAQLMIAQGGGDVAIPANASTVALTIGGNNTQVLQGANDQFVATMDGAIMLSLGATPPTALQFQYTISGGAVLATMSLSALLLVANANFLVPLALVGPSSRSAYAAAGTPQIQVNPTGQAVTVRSLGSQAIFRLAIGGP